VPNCLSFWSHINFTQVLTERLLHVNCGGFSGLPKAHSWSHSLPSVSLLVQVIVASVIAHRTEFLFLSRTGTRTYFVQPGWALNGHQHVELRRRGKPPIPRKRVCVRLELEVTSHVFSFHSPAQHLTKRTLHCILLYYLCLKIVHISLFRCQSISTLIRFIKKV